MPPLLAGKTDIKRRTIISGIPGVVVSILADHTACIGLTTYAIVRRRRR
jgi:hypothetical protein